MDKPTPHKPHPYYDRPSKQTSYQIAAIAIICLVIMLLGLMVSEVVNDFTNNSNNGKEDNKGEISYKMERRYKKGWKIHKVSLNELACITSY